MKTDHAFLKWLLKLKDHNGRLMRWALLLQDYTYVIMHRAGKAHANADALSRLIQLECIESQQTGGQSSAIQDKPDQPFMSSIANAVLRSQDDPYGVKQRQRAKEAELQRKKEEEEKSNDQRQQPSQASTRSIDQGAQEMLKKGEAFKLKEKHGVLLMGDELGGR
jgi:hypothetical protein